jgi:hypothetical protein
LYAVASLARSNGRYTICIILQLKIDLICVDRCHGCGIAVGRSRLLIDIIVKIEVYFVVVLRYSRCNSSRLRG